MFPNNYKKEVVKLIHLLTDNEEYYYTSLAKIKQFEKCLDKMINLLEEIKNGKDN